MACIVYQTNKKTGIKYAYESESYWDPEKKQPRSRRKYIGKVDPETGEIISTKRGAGSGNGIAPEAIGRLERAIVEKDRRIAELEKAIEVLTKKHETLLKELHGIIQQAE